MSEELLPVFEFDRYRDGELKAQGIRITRQRTLLAAISKATTLAEPGDVLVLRPTPPSAGDAEVAEKWLRSLDSRVCALENLLAQARREERERAAGILSEEIKWLGGTEKSDFAKQQLTFALNAIRAGDASQEKKDE